MSNFNLKGKSFLVTGGSSGIGKQIALDLLNEQASIVATARREALLTDLKQLSSHPDLCSYFCVDMAQESDIKTLVPQLPTFDGLVLNAGMAEYTPARFASRSKAEAMFNINFLGNVTLVAELLKAKKIKPGASIVFTSSISSHLGVPGTALYAASKAAVNAYARVLATELAPQKVRVNCVLPGIVMTDLIDSQSSLTEDIIAKNAAQYPLGLGKASQVSGPVLFLLSDFSSWMTGTEMRIDGGQALL